MRLKHSAWILSESDNRQLEELNLLYGYTTRELVEMIFCEACPDLVPGEGPEFIFSRPHMIGPDYFAGAMVPEPDDNVNLPYAMDIAQHDIITAEYLLNHYDLSTPALFSMMANHLSWWRFFAVRHPDPARRERYSAMAAKDEAVLNGLLERAQLKSTSLKIVGGRRCQS